MCVRVRRQANACHGTCLEVGGQISGVSFVPPPCFEDSRLLFLPACFVLLAGLWISNQFPSLSPISLEEFWNLRCVPRHLALYMSSGNPIQVSRLPEQALSPPELSLWPSSASWAENPCWAQLRALRGLAYWMAKGYYFYGAGEAAQPVSACHTSMRAWVCITHPPIKSWVWRHRPVVSASTGRCRQVGTSQPGWLNQWGPGSVRHPVSKKTLNIDLWPLNACKLICLHIPPMSGHMSLGEGLRSLSNTASLQFFIWKVLLYLFMVIYPAVHVLVCTTRH